MEFYGALFAAGMGELVFLSRRFDVFVLDASRLASMQDHEIVADEFLFTGTWISQGMGVAVCRSGGNDVEGTHGFVRVLCGQKVEFWSSRWR